MDELIKNRVEVKAESKLLRASPQAFGSGQVAVPKKNRGALWADIKNPAPSAKKELWGGLCKAGVCGDPGQNGKITL